MDSSKLKDVLRKVAHPHRKSTSQDSNVIPSSAHAEQKPLPKPPVTKQQTKLTQSLPERNLQTSTSIDQNHEPRSQAVHQKRESLSRSFEQNRTAKHDPYSVASSSTLNGRPTHSASHMTSPDAVARAKAERDPDARANQDSLPAIAHHKMKSTGTGNTSFQAKSKRDHSSRHGHNPRQSNDSSLNAETHVLPKEVHGGQDVSQKNRPEELLASDIDAQLRIQGIDLNNTTDSDQTTHWAPAVIHEVIKPTVHHIREEKLHKEIHNYEVYHRIQPVYETVVLPARHFAPNPNGEGLIEISESMLPDCTGDNQRWYIGEQQSAPGITRKPVAPTTQPRIAEEKTYITPEGFPRTETTTVHPPTLEDMSGYDGPVRTIHFPNGSAPDEEIGYHKGVPKHARDTMPTASGKMINSQTGLPSPPESAASIMASPPGSPVDKKSMHPGQSMLEV